MMRIKGQVDAAAYLSAAFALAASAAALIGWATDDAWLKSFGAGRYVSQPLTSAAIATLAIALLARLRGNARTAYALLAAAACVAAESIFNRATGIESGLHMLLFPQAIEEQVTPRPGHVGLTAAASIVGLAIAIVLAPRVERRARRAISALCAAVLAVAAASLVIVPIIAPPVNAVVRIVELSSLPTAIGLAALAIALLIWRGDIGQPGRFAVEGIEDSVMRTVLLAIIMAPIATEFVQDSLKRSGVLSAPAADLLETALIIVAMAGLLFWAAGRIRVEHRARRALIRALDSAPIALTDTDGLILHWSKGCERLYGWSAEEARGRRKHELLNTRLSAGASIPLDGLLRNAGAWDEEIVENAKDGEALHVLENARLLESRHGGDPVFVLSMTDISARKRAEAALVRSEARVGIAIRAHEIGTVQWDGKTGAVQYSPETERRLGLEPGMVTDQASWAKYVHPDDARVLVERAQAAIAAHEPRYSYRLRFIRPDGDVRTLEGSTAIIYDADGAVSALVGAHVDVTARDAREAKLAASEAQLRSILETVPDAMIVVDERGIIQTFSSAAERMFGYPVDEVMGQSVRMLIVRATGIERDGKPRQALDPREPGALGRPHRLTGVHRDGSQIPVEVIVGEARVDGRTLYTSFVRDLTERLAAEARFADLQGDLNHVSRLSAMGEMASGLAHELNQPLTASVNNLTAAGVLLARAEAAPQVTRLIETAREQALGAGRIIRRLRSFVERGEVQMVSEQLREIVTDAVALSLSASSRTEVDVDVDLDSACERVMADRVQIQQVLVNLLRNAVEAMAELPREQRRIAIQSRCGTVGGLVTVSVADSGPGLSDAAAEELFKPFSSTKQNGMGVGLSICRRIVEAHGGALRAENRKGGGAFFQFTLRSAQAELPGGR